MNKGLWCEDDNIEQKIKQKHVLQNTKIKTLTTNEQLIISFSFFLQRRLCVVMYVVHLCMICTFKASYYMQLHMSVWTYICKFCTYVPIPSVSFIIPLHTCPQSTFLFKKLRNLNEPLFNSPIWTLSMGGLISGFGRLAFVSMTWGGGFGVFNCFVWLWLLILELTLIFFTAWFDFKLLLIVVGPPASDEEGDMPAFSANNCSLSASLDATLIWETEPRPKAAGWWDDATLSSVSSSELTSIILLLVGGSPPPLASIVGDGLLSCNKKYRPKSGKSDKKKARLQHNMQPSFFPSSSKAENVILNGIVQFSLMLINVDKQRRQGGSSVCRKNNSCPHTADSDSIIHLTMVVILSVYVAYMCT